MVTVSMQIEDEDVGEVGVAVGNFHGAGECWDKARRFEEEQAGLVQGPTPFNDRESSSDPSSYHRTLETRNKNLIQYPD
jgi:hypothetical protein